MRISLRQSSVLSIVYYLDEHSNFPHSPALLTRTVGMSIGAGLAIQMY